MSMYLIDLKILFTFLSYAFELRMVTAPAASLYILVQKCYDTFREVWEIMVEAWWFQQKWHVCAMISKEIER